MGGTDESPTLVQEMEMMVDTLYAIGIGGDYMVNLEIVSGGQHNEQLWREEFGEAYEWLFLEDPYNIFSYSPDIPVSMYYHNGKLTLKANHNNQGIGPYHVQLFAINGQLVLDTEITRDEPITLPSGLSGIYIARIGDETYVSGQKVFIPGR